MSRNQTEIMVRYSLIDRLLQGGNKVKTKDIIAELAKIDINRSEKTIQNDIRAMRDDPLLGFEAPIKEDKSTKSWYYTDPEYKIPPNRLTISNKELAETFLFHLSLLKRYSKNPLFQKLSPTITNILENLEIKKQLPYSLEDITAILITEIPLVESQFSVVLQVIRAILENKEIHFSYQKYSDKSPRLRRFYPCVIREHGDRWYVLGVERSGQKVKMFAFDRIDNLIVTNQKFQSPQKDWQSLCKDSFGVTIGDQEAVQINLSFPISQYGYISSKKLHHSQKLVKKTDTEFMIEVTVRPTWELYAKLLSYGAFVKVLSPSFVRDELKKRLKEALNQYN